MIDAYEFRQIRPEEAEEAAEVERICFPPNEACSREQMLARVRIAPSLFMVAVDGHGKIAGLLNGIATNETVFRDAFFEDANLHQPDGRRVMLLGLDVLPEYREQGIARELVRLYREKERNAKREQLVLTCVEGKIGMYEKMGFVSRGVSASVWGGTKWYEMYCDL